VTRWFYLVLKLNPDGFLCGPLRVVRPTSDPPSAVANAFRPASSYAKGYGGQAGGQAAVFCVNAFTAFKINRTSTQVLAFPCVTLWCCLKGQYCGKLAFTAFCYRASPKISAFLRLSPPAVSLPNGGSVVN